MMLSADIAPPNSLLLIMDRSAGKIPQSMDGNLIAFTSTCVAVGTRSEHDGSTRVTLDAGPVSRAHGSPTFDKVLDTPGRKLAVCSVLEDVLLEIGVSAERTRVRIWANDPTEPNEIHILASGDEA